MRRLVSTESLGHIVGLALIASAIHQSYTKEGYDPAPQITTGILVMSGTYLAPTQKLDERLQQTTEKIDRVIKE